MYKLLKELTIEELISWSPCLSRDEILTSFDGRESLSLQDILALDIPTRHKLRILLHPELIPKGILHEFMCRCAEEALKVVKNPDKRSIAVIEAKRKWLRGEISDEQLIKAKDVAWDVVNSYSIVTADHYVTTAYYVAKASYAAATTVCYFDNAYFDNAYYTASYASYADTFKTDYWEKQLAMLLKLLEGN